MRKGNSFQRRPAVGWLLFAAIATLFGLILLMPLTALGLTREEAALQEAWQQGEVVRLHILAEDDSPKAQVMKLAVRDRVLTAFAEELSNSNARDAQAVMQLLENRLDSILYQARQTAYACGFRGSVTAQTGRMQLPARRYGQVELPAGSYHALRITLGEGKGRNWWCVLFPQLCLSAVSDEPWQSPSPAAPAFHWYGLDVLKYWPLLMPA